MRFLFGQVISIRELTDGTLVDKKKKEKKKGENSPRLDEAGAVSRTIFLSWDVTW